MTVEKLCKNRVYFKFERKSISLPPKAKIPEERFCSVIECCVAK